MASLWLSVLFYSRGVIFEGLLGHSVTTAQSQLSQNSFKLETTGLWSLNMFQMVEVGQNQVWIMTFPSCYPDTDQLSRRIWIGRKSSVGRPVLETRQVMRKLEGSSAPSVIPNTAAAKFKFLSEEYAWTTRSPMAAPPMSMPDGMQQGKLQCWCRCPCCMAGGRHTGPVSCLPTGIAGGGQAAHLIPRSNPPFLSAEGACLL